MIDNSFEASKSPVSPVISSVVPDFTDNWLELEFYTQSQRLKGQISCPAGMRILDMLNTPCDPNSNDKTEFLELKGYSKTGNNFREPQTVCIKKDDILFVSAPDVNMGRGLGAKGEFKVFPFVPKEKMRVSIRLNSYSITGTLFRANNQTMMDVLNDGMFFLPLTYAMISKDNCDFGDRPFVAINKKQVCECKEEFPPNAREALDEVVTLSGIVPICGWCRKIRNTSGDWQVVRHYVKNQANLEFSHSICPVCMTKHFPD
jgi:hypothetical protein